MYIITMTNKNLPNVFDYLDFRKYLAHYYHARKMIEPGFSHTYMCYRLGQRNAKSYFSNVVKGVKTVTAEFINRFIELLELTTDEAHYFRDLVNFNQSANHKEKEYYFDRLVKQISVQKRLIGKNEYVFYSGWEHSVIRALLDIGDFRDDYAALAKMLMPPLPIKMVKRSVRLLQSLNLIHKDKNGFFKPTDKTVKTDEHVRDELILQYQLHCLEMARMNMLNKHGLPQDISTNILSVSEDGLKKVQNRLGKFREEIRAIVQNDERPSDRVYQLDIQLFPNSKVHLK
jgi:hypothetical protein, TIGR02147